MDLYAIIDQVVPLLQKHGRMTYRAIKYQFQLDDEGLAALKEELIDGQRVAVDEDGKVLVWKDRLASRVQSLGSEEHQPLTQSPQTLDPKLKDSRLDAAERRQLTVMFCDLVGSTALSEQLDPEELREVVRLYQETCAAVIQRYAGHIAQHLGDGLLVYFGYPVAHEDDAQRAVRAGREIIDALRESPLQKRQLPQPIQVRIGIHTGLVVIGEIGSSEKHEVLALGETPNIAARVQGVAEPDTVVISAVTQHLVHGLFECQDLGPQTLKGISTPLSLYRVVRENAAQSRFEVAVRTGLTPIIGRAPELGLLQVHWEQAKTGAGQVVLLSGEPGIGKSRLVQEFTEQLAREGVTRITFRCSPYHQNSALYPIIDHLQRLLQFARDDTPVVKLEKLQHTLSRYRFSQADTLPLLAALLSLPHPEGAPPLTLSPQKQKQKTQEALVAWIVEEADKAAVYCAWEDLHWADPSTIEVLTLFLEHVPTTRLLAVLTFRPEFQPPWDNRAYLSQLTLSRLERSQVEAMIEQVRGDKALPSGVVQHIVAKTDGVPLFVEELTKTVVETMREPQGNWGEGQLGLSSFPLSIPLTLQDALMARLDRLGPAKELAQLGATLGREFSYELLHTVSPLDEERLQHGLKQLVTAELVYQRGLAPQAHYLFKHALIQDTAYQSLLKSTRQQYHRQIARMLAEQFPETKETQPELVAHHYTEAGLAEHAIPYWQRAGKRATQRSAYVEAVAHLTKGLEVLKALPDTAERVQQELTLQIALGGPLTAIKGFGAPEVEKAHGRALELCRQVGETPRLFNALFGLWAFYGTRAGHQTARQLGEQLVSLAQRRQNPALLLPAHGALGFSLFWLGEITLSRAHQEQGIALYNSQQHHSYFPSWPDPGVVCPTYAALALWSLGYPDQALKRSREALTLAQELSHPFSLAFALHSVASLYQLRREEQNAQEWAEALIALVAEQGFTEFLAYGTFIRGWALTEQGEGKEGITQMEQGLIASRATGAEQGRTGGLIRLIAAYANVGQVEEGLSVLTEALAFVSKTGERVYEAELYRLKGELTLQQSRASLRRVQDKSQTSQNKSEVLNAQHPTLNTQTEACFRQAIEIARKQQAKSWELRATTSLARLWQSQGKQAEARQMLAEIYGWFTEGFDTRDLQEAKVLLEELSLP